MRTLLVLGAAVAALTGLAAQHDGRAALPTAQQGRIYLLANGAGTGRKGVLYVVDETGRRSVLTDFGSPPLPGHRKQPDGKYVSSIAVEGDGTILVVDRQSGAGATSSVAGAGQLFAVDPSTGDRRVLSDFGDPKQGPRGKNPRDVAILPDGRILVTVGDAGGGCGLTRCGAIFTVDPVTGRRSILSDFGNPAQGPVIPLLGGLTVDRSGRIYVGAGDIQGLVFTGVERVDAATGQRTIVESGGVGAIFTLAAQPDGTLLGTACCTELFRVDPVLHTVTLLSDLEDPSHGPCYCAGLGNSMTVVTGTPSPTLSAGTVLLSSDIGAVLTLDRTTRARTMLSDFTNPAQGPSLDPSKATMAGIAFVPGTAAPPPPPPPPTGTILTFAGQFGHPSLYAVDPATGMRTQLSDLTDPSEGQTLGNWRIASDFGHIVATGLSTTQQDDGLLVRIDPSTGQRTVVSDFQNPAQGPIGYTPFGVFVLSSTSYLVTDRGQGGGGNGAALWGVDNGVRTKITDFNDPSEGPLGKSPEGVAIDGSGQMWVVDAEAGTDCTGFGDHCGGLFRVAPNGQRTLVSDFGDPAQGPLGDDPVGLVLDADGSFLVIDQFAGACGCGELFRVYPATGQRVLLSDFGNAAQGPSGGRNPTAVAVAADGSILTDGCPGASGNGAICRIDRLTGNRTNFADFGDPSLGPVVIGPMGTLAISR